GLLDGVEFADVVEHDDRVAAGGEGGGDCFAEFGVVVDPGPRGQAVQAADDVGEQGFPGAWGGGGDCAEWGEAADVGPQQRCGEQGDVVGEAGLVGPGEIAEHVVEHELSRSGGVGGVGDVGDGGDGCGRGVVQPGRRVVALGLEDGAVGSDDGRGDDAAQGPQAGPPGFGEDRFDDGSGGHGWHFLGAVAGGPVADGAGVAGQQPLEAVGGDVDDGEGCPLVAVVGGGGEVDELDEGAVADVGVGEDAVVARLDEVVDALGGGPVDGGGRGDAGGGDDVLSGRAARVGLGHRAPPVLRSPEWMVL